MISSYCCAWIIRALFLKSGYIIFRINPVLACECAKRNIKLLFVVNCALLGCYAASSGNSKQGSVVIYFVTEVSNDSRSLVLEHPETGHVS